MLGRGIQDTVVAELKARLGSEMVVKEWSVRQQAKDAFLDPATYAPRLDVAIGPFNVRHEDRQKLVSAIRDFNPPEIQMLLGAVYNQNPHFFENKNPRCGIAIEIEHATSSKHILGAIANVSLLGRIGIVIGSTERIEKIRRIHTYVRKLRDVEKASRELFGNVGCFEQGEFIALLGKRQRVISA